MCPTIGWRTLETCVSSSPRTNGTGLTWACQWSPLAVLFHCPMCLACKIIFKWCRNVGQVWIQTLDFILSRAPAPFRNGHLSGWHESIQRQAWSCSEMCLNNVCVWICVMFWFDEFGTEVSVQSCILIDCRWWSILTSCTPWTGFWNVLHLWRGDLFADLYFMWKWQSGFDTCYIVNYWHMSWHFA